MKIIFHMVLAVKLLKPHKPTCARADPLYQTLTFADAVLR
jgi:hypothetical protein